MIASARPDVTKLEYLRCIRQSEIDPNAVFPAYRRFVSWIDSQKADRTVEHYVRYCNTFAAICRANIALDGDVCETGGLGPVGLFLRAEGVRCTATTGDLRAPLGNESEAFDVVLSLEVLEHIKDQPERDFSDIVLFRGTGARNYVSEMIRILKPGGTLILTTPNPCGLWAIQQAIAFQPPMNFSRHVREYTKSEVLGLFSELECLRYESHFSFFLLSERSRIDLINAFAKFKWPTEERGDDHFFVFRKPRK